LSAARAKFLRQATRYTRPCPPKTTSSVSLRGFVPWVRFTPSSLPRITELLAPSGRPPRGSRFEGHPRALSGDKPKLLQALKDSRAHFRGAIIALSEADADKPQRMFGQQTTVRGSFIMITGHDSEHLGQSIAYARVNGGAPLWTEEAMQQQQKPAEKPKP
jgi:hypothetical protein